jgi:DNA-binding response OmpR family regulator
MGFAVRTVASGQGLLALVEDNWPELVILDVVLSDVSGLIVCGKIRARRALPVVFYSASRRREDPILARMLGADEFLIKWVDEHEFQARIEMVLRRARGSSSSPANTRFWERSPGQNRHTLRERNLVIDLQKHQVMAGGQEIQLTPVEFRLLTTLASQPGHVFSRRDLAVEVWRSDENRSSRTMTAHISRLRAKLRASPAPIAQILPARGAGYKLISTDEHPVLIP